MTFYYHSIETNVTFVFLYLLHFFENIEWLSPISPVFLSLFVVNYSVESLLPNPRRPFILNGRAHLNVSGLWERETGKQQRAKFGIRRKRQEK